MKNIAFVIWVLGLPTLYTIELFLKAKISGKWPESDASGGFIVLAIWIIVAVLTYEQ
jgi:hypothetical protein